MATSVQFYGPDGVLRTTLAFSLTQTSRFFTGVLPEDAVDVEVSLYGQGYTSDSTLVSFSSSGFTIPNPASFPNGLDLFSGDNVIRVRSVNLSGGRSPEAVATVRLLPPATTDVFSPPTNIVLERLDGSVRVRALGVTDSRVTGYNFYAAADTGGGSVGYSRINVNVIASGEKIQTVSELYRLTSSNIARHSDPLYYRAKIDQETAAEVVLSTDVDSRVEIPQTVTDVQTDVIVSSVTTDTYYSFDHDRRGNSLSVPPTIFSGIFASTPPTELLYYVVTAVYFDTTVQTEYESYFSTEVSGAPASVRQQINGITAVTRQQILESAIASIYRQNPYIAVQPGAVVRDIFLDPFVTESERLRLILDYIYRASSFDTLLLVDDPSGSGTSIDPASSSYKTALAAAFFFSNANDVQKVIDGSFDKLAANFNATRAAGTSSIGEVRFYTSFAPTSTVDIPLGTAVNGGGIEFRTTRSASLPLGQLASFYNPSTRQYSLTVPVRATTVGSVTNVGPRQISSTNVYGMSVTNDAATFGGSDEETNAALAARSRTALASVDTGTSRGYLQTAAGVPGTVQNFLVRSGSPFMLRDYDSTLRRHLGGSVDVWARGLRPVTVTDSFAFTYERRNDVQFVLLGSPLNYTFRAISDETTPDNPLSQMLNYPALGLGLKNATTGEMFDLTNVVYLDFNTIQLDATRPQPPVTLTDIVLGDFRFRLGNSHLFSRQPVNAVFTVVGEVTGSLDFSLFTLVHPNSPLGLGRSTRAGDYLQINQSTDPTVVSPSGNLIAVSNEPHAILGFYPEYLNNLGADTLSLVVKDGTATITYKGPYDPSGTPDYTIVEGTATTAAAIQRTTGSTIPDGSSIFISYSYYENFTVTYQTNLVTSALQQALDDGAHATADVLAKQAVQIPVDITATVILKKGVDRADADTAIRNNLQYLVGTLKLGDPLRRSDVISEIDRTDGVSYVVVPLTKMVRAIGYPVVRNDLSTAAFGDSFRVAAWSNSRFAVWLLIQELDVPTTTGGGPATNFRAVYQDDEALPVQTSAPSGLGVQGGVSYIIGDDGLAIPGYGTDLVRNRVLVSLPIGESPSDHSYWATYTTAPAIGDHDITTNAVEFVVLGDVLTTYDVEPSR